MKKVFLFLSNIKPIFISLSVIILFCLNCKDELVNIEEQQENLKAPGSLNIISLSETSLRLSWKDNSSLETSIVVERGEGYTPQSYATIATVADNVTEYEDNQLDKTKIYSYRVKAVKESSESPYSPKISVQSRDGTLQKTFTGHNSTIFAIDVSPNGQYLATGSADHTIRLWDITTGNSIHTLTEHSDMVTSVVFSPDGQKLASGSSDDWIILWDANSGNIIRKIYTNNSLYSLTYSPDGQKVACGLLYGWIMVYDTFTGDSIMSIPGDWLKYDAVASISFSPDGNRILAAYDPKYSSDDDEIKMWNALTGDEIWSIPIEFYSISHVVFQPDGNAFVVTNGNTVNIPAIQLRQTTDGTIIRSYEGYSSGANWAAFSTNGQRLATAGNDGTDKIWDVNSGNLLYSILDPTNTFIYSIDFTPDGERIATAGLNRIATLLKIESEWIVIP